MKRLLIFVEGQTEEEFVNSVIAPHLRDEFGILSVIPIKIATSAKAKGGFVSYEYLKNDVQKRIREQDVIVSMFVDYFRIPVNLPDYSTCLAKGSVDDRIQCLENAIRKDIGFPNFIPYIQKHEFEALLFSSNKGFEDLFDESVYHETQSIIGLFSNPEEINSHPKTAPSKRLQAIMPNYDKVTDGSMIAMEIGVETILKKCPRFRKWIEELVEAMVED